MVYVLKESAQQPVCYILLVYLILILINGMSRLVDTFLGFSPSTGLFEPVNYVAIHQHLLLSGIPLSVC